MLRRLVTRLLGRDRPGVVHGIGWFRGGHEVQPFDLMPLLRVDDQTAQRLRLGDTIRFDVDPAAPDLATRVVVTHRVMP